MGDVLGYLAGLLVLIGAGLGLLGGIGMLRFPNLYARLHAASLAGTLGVGFSLLAIALISYDIGVLVRAMLGILFIILTGPVAAHLLARAALKTDDASTNNLDI